MATKLSRDEAVQIATEMRAAAARWLFSNSATLFSDRANTAHLYRYPLALTLAGYPTQASEAMDLLADQVLGVGGDLRSGPLRDRFSHRWSSYPLALMVCGTHLLGKSDLTDQIINRLRTDFVDPWSGGAFSERREVRTSDRQDLFPTAQIGITGHLVGATDLTDGAAKWVSALWSAQEKLPTIVTTSTLQGDLIRSDDAKHESRGILEMSEPRQPYAAPGIAAALLAIRYRSNPNPNPEELATARKYLGLYDLVHPSAYAPAKSVQLCKKAWGAAELLRATSEQAYERKVFEMVDWFSAGITKDGCWVPPATMQPWKAATASAVSGELTAEFVQHLTTCLEALADSDSSNAGRHSYGEAQNHREPAERKS